jgi:hypothetical protein
MLYLAQFHSGSLAAAFLLGLGMGWIALVHRGAEIPLRWLVRFGVLLAGLIALSAWRVLPGRPGYWLDLALLLFFAYFAGCTVGTWLRSLLVAHQSRPRKPAA